MVLPRAILYKDIISIEPDMAVSMKSTMPKASTSPALEGTQVKKVKVQKADLQFHEIEVKDPVLKNTKGEVVPVGDYFFAREGEKAIAPSFFNKACGMPCDREDLVEIFNKVFNPEDNFVFLKSYDKEVYGVLVPLKYSDIGAKEESVLGDYQFHAISFVMDGSVNHEKLRRELKKIAGILKYENK